jgi:hypothetical protein
MISLKYLNVKRIRDMKYSAYSGVDSTKGLKVLMKVGLDQWCELNTPNLYLRIHTPTSIQVVTLWSLNCITIET